MTYLGKYVWLAVAPALLCGVSLAQAPNKSAKASPKANQAKAINTVDGKTLFNNHCASCHGTDGRGAGPAAAGLKSAPPDLTTISQRNNGTFPRQRVEAIISGEQTSAAAHGSRQMPVWGPVFSQVEWDMDFVQVRLDNLARYIETLQRPASNKK